MFGWLRDVIAKGPAGRSDPRRPAGLMMKDNSAKETHWQGRIVAAAKDLFHKQGVRATNVDDIVQSLGISRREFYRSFRTKQRLAKEVVLAYLEEIESGRSRLYPKLASWNDFRRCLAQQVTFLNEFNMLRGCPLAIIGANLREKDDSVRQVVSLVFEALTKRMTAFFRKQKMKGHLCRSAPEGQLAEFCVSVMQGAMLIGKVRRESEDIKGVFKELTAHLEEFRSGLTS